MVLSPRNIGGFIVARREIHNELDRKNRNNHNDNYSELYRLKRTVNDLVLNADGDSNAEVVQARAGEDTLNDRLDKMEDESSSLSGDISSLESDIDDKLDDKASLSDLDKYSQETEDSLEKKLKEVEDTIDDVVGNIEFKGAMLSLKDNQEIKSGGTWHTLDWGKAVYNESGFWSSKNKSRITIPEGVKKVRLTSNILWSSKDGGRRGLRLRKNGNYVGGGFYSMNYGQGTSPNGGTSSPLEVVEGDYFEVEVLQNSGETLDLREDPYTHVSVEVLSYGKK